jgi:hypothetical protein
MRASSFNGVSLILQCIFHQRCQTGTVPRLHVTHLIVQKKQMWTIMDRKQIYSIPYSHCREATRNQMEVAILFSVRSGWLPAAMQ